MAVFAGMGAQMRMAQTRLAQTRAPRALAFTALLCVLLFLNVKSPAQSAPSTKPEDAGWTVLFRSDTPELWNSDAGTLSHGNGFAMPVAQAPQEMRFLRLTRMDTGAAIIIGIDKARLTRATGLDSGVYWNGADSAADGYVLLGVARSSWPAVDDQQQIVLKMPGRQPFRGWGFSTPTGKQVAQTYSWRGNPIDKTVFEIAVKSDELTADELKKLLTTLAGDGQPVPGANGVVNSAEAGTTRPTRLQSTIKSLWVRHTPSGEMLGDCEDFILTATPGKPRGDSAPVTFTTNVGPQMHLVLDDVARAINVKYPHIIASKLELSFEDKYGRKDGGSIGAACGTLLLSIIQNFEIDPRVAITGDVTADAKVRRIGGVAAKIRGATAAGCTIVALPADNYDQVVDAFIYEGPSLLTNMQVLSIANLDDAAAVSRIDRTLKLRLAIEAFADLQPILRSTPDRVHTRVIQDRLAQVVELAPNHLSARLLLMLGQNKQPKKLSGAATMYYTNVAVEMMLPSLLDAKPDIKMAAPAVVQDGLRKLQKVRWYADPQFLPLVNATQEFMQTMSDVQDKRASEATLKTKAEAVLNEASKLGVDRDLSEKMSHEGI